MFYLKSAATDVEKPLRVPSLSKVTELLMNKKQAGAHTFKFTWTASKQTRSTDHRMVLDRRGKVL